MIVELIAAGASAVVGAMATDTWDQVKTQVSRLFGRAGTSESTVQGRLEATRALVTAPGADPAVLAQAEEAWRVRLADLLEEHPELASDLEQIVAATGGQGGVTAGSVTQNAVARDNAQQAVQGHGVQKNEFRSHP